MPDELENRINRRNTDAFIAYDAFSVILSHATSVPTAAGGTIRGVTSQRVAQTARTLPRSTDASPITRLLDGEDTSATVVMIMAWDAVVERGDWFYRNGNKFEVLWVYRNTYEVKADVADRG